MVVDAVFGGFGQIKFNLDKFFGDWVIFEPFADGDDKTDIFLFPDATARGLGVVAVECGWTAEGFVFVILFCPKVFVKS